MTAMGTSLGAFASLGGLITQAVPLTATSTAGSLERRAPSTGISLATTVPISPSLISAPVPRRSGYSFIQDAIDSINLSPSTVSSVQIVRPDLFRRATIPSEGALSLSHLRVDNNNFIQTNLNGITFLRPEIIALTDFNPLVDDNSKKLNTVGNFIDVQYQARSLRDTTVVNLVHNIRSNQNTTNDFSNIQNQFLNQFSKIDNAVDFYKQTIEAIKNIKESFNLKTIPDSSFDTRFFQTLKGFYRTRMLYSNESFNHFSNTKIFNQLMFDFRSMLENYSLSLLNLTDPDRIHDTSPVNIDKTYTLTSGFTFNINNIRSNNPIPENAASQDFFSRFLDSLPLFPEDRIKLLIAVLSKELRVSSGMTDTETRRILRDVFQTSQETGNVFDNIVGTVGNTIFEAPLGENSLSSVGTLNLVNNSFIFPFETKYVDSPSNNKTYVPGTSYFVDSILNIQDSRFNTRPYIEFVDKFTSILDGATSVLNKLFIFSPRLSNLANTEIYKRFVFGLQRNISGLLSGTEDVNRAQATSICLLRLANTDRNLKLMLFQYLILLTIKTNPHISDRPILDNLVRDFGGLVDNLRFLNQIRGDLTGNIATDPSLVQSYLNQISETIQNRVYHLLGISSETESFAGSTVLRPGSGESFGFGTAGSFTPQTSQPSPISRNVPLRRISFDVDSVSSIQSVLRRPEGTILQEFVDLILSFDNGATANQASQGSTLNYLDATGRTRFNYLSSSTLFLLVYEILNNFVFKYTNCNFTRSNLIGQIDMLFDTALHDQVTTMFSEILRSVSEAIFVEPRVSTRSLGASVPSTTLTSRISVDSVGLGGISRFAQEQRNVSQVAQVLGSSPASVQNAIAGNMNFLDPNFSNTFQASAASISDNLNLYGVNAYQTSLYSIEKKLFDEDLAVANVLHILNVIYRRMAASKERIISYFTNATLTAFTQQANIDNDDLVNLLNDSQVRIMIDSKEKYSKQLNRSGNELGQQIGFVSTLPNELNVKNIIYSLFSENKYQTNSIADKKIKLLTIGIPFGFSKNLTSRLNASTIDLNSFAVDKQYDVIAVNVFKKNLEYEDIVFKPKKFLFDLSLFNGSYEDLDVRLGESFSAILQRIKLVDYQNVNNVKFLTLSNILSDQSYDFLTTSQKQELFSNHVISDVVSLYLKYMTTVYLKEDIFIDKQSKTYKNNFSAMTEKMSSEFEIIVIKYLNEVLNKNLPSKALNDLIADPNVDQESKDILQLLAFGNLIFNSNKLFLKLLSPKLFDRILSVPINIDDFEIDVAKTVSTNSGLTLYNKDFFQNLIERKMIGNTELQFFKTRDRNDTYFEDYFINIELIS